MQDCSSWESICTVNSSNTPRSAGSGQGTACRCHPGELDAILEAVAIEDFTVSATDLSIPSTAQDCALHSRLARTLPESVAGSLTGQERTPIAAGQGISLRRCRVNTAPVIGGGMTHVVHPRAGG